MSIIAKIIGFVKKNPLDSEKDTHIKSHLYLGKFVKQNNMDIGESIAIDGRRIIIKNSTAIFSVPIDVIIKNTEHIAVGDFDTEESIRLGKVWAARKDVLKFDEKGMMIK